MTALRSFTVEFYKNQIVLNFTNLLVLIYCKFSYCLEDIVYIAFIYIQCTVWMKMPNVLLVNAEIVVEYFRL